MMTGIRVLWCIDSRARPENGQLGEVVNLVTMAQILVFMVMADAVLYFAQRYGK
jgi:hypothetical protein